MLHLGALRRVAPPFGRRLLPRYRRAAALWGGHDLVITKLVVVGARRRLIYTNLGDDAHVVSIFIVDEDEADALLRWVRVMQQLLQGAAQLAARARLCARERAGGLGTRAQTSAIVLGRRPVSPA